MGVSLRFYAARLWNFIVKLRWQIGFGDPIQIYQLHFSISLTSRFLKKLKINGKLVENASDANIQIDENSKGMVFKSAKR
jgi:hypothetical protein